MALPNKILGHTDTVGSLAVTAVILKAGIKAAVQDAIAMMLLVQEIHIDDLSLPGLQLIFCHGGNNFRQLWGGMIPAIAWQSMFHPDTQSRLIWARLILRRANSI